MAPPLDVDAAAPVDGGTPAAPTLISPIDNEVIASAPRLTWLGSVNAVGYSVTAWSAGNPAKVMCQTASHGLTADCLDVPPGAYEWSVRSIGIDGHLGGISATGSFTRSALSLTAPGLVSPANGAVLDYPDSVGRLRWQAVPGAARYQLEVSSSPTFPEGDPDLMYSYHDLSTNVPVDQVGVPRYWRVRGVNEQATAAGPWSAIRTFTVTWSEIPVPVSPADGGSASNIVLVWSPVKGATNYEFEVTTAADTDFSEATRTTPSWPGNHWGAWGATPAGDLRWRVRARNADDGVTAWSAARTIHRDPNAPAAPEPDPIPPPDVTLASPPDGATVPSPTDALLTWTPVAGAIAYEIDARLSTGDWFNTGWTVGAGPFASNFDAGSIHHWRVRSIGEGNVPGAWSTDRQLTVASPVSVVISSPAAGGDVPESRPIVSWQAAAGAGTYWVDICDNPGFTGGKLWSQIAEGTSTVLGPEVGTGRWYLRVRGGPGVTLAQSDVRAFDIVDDLAPSGWIDLAGGTPWTSQPSIDVQVDSDDGPDAATEVQLSADRSTWESHSLPGYGSLSVPWSLTAPAHGGSAPGQRTVYAKFRDAAGNWSPIVAASTWYGMENPPDSTPPIGTISIAAGAAYTITRSPLIHIPATDLNGVTMISLSTDGVTWVDRPYWPDQQVTLSSANGLKTVRVKWRDWGGNWSAASSDTITLDTVAPTVTAPTYAFVSGVGLSSTSTPTKFSWSGTDATSGVARYEAAISTDGGAYTAISTSLLSATVTRNLSAGHTYRLRVRAVDKAGLTGAWVYGSTFTVSAYQETSSRITYTGTWYRPASTSYWGGYAKYRKTSGGKAAFTFTGRAYALIGCVGPTRGSFDVWVNGVLVKTVSTYSATTSCKRVLVSLSWSTAISRKVTIVVKGTSGHPRVDVDAIVAAY
jgi:hypothetical protein